MKILHLKAQDFVTTSWSGGTTTQLLIWPEGANYATREFGVRISSAVVALEESDFTPLAGVQRYITPLSGGFTLTHPGKAPVVMAPLDPPYAFSGEEATHCVGPATDFNLMLKGVQGQRQLSWGKMACAPGMHAFYAPQARQYQVDGKVYPMAPGELLVLFADAPTTVDLGEGNSLACYAAI